MSINLPITVRIKTRRLDSDVSAQLGGLRFRSSVPGGFESCEFTLHRSLSFQPDDIEYYARVYLYDARHSGTIWEGRILDPGRSAGDDGELWQIVAMGPQTHMADRTFGIIYVDRSLDRWSRSQYSERSALTDQGELDSDTPTLEVMAPEGTAISSTTPQWKGDWIYRALNFTGQKLARVRCTQTAGAATAVFQAGIYTRIGNASGAFVDLQNWSSGAGSLGATYGSAGWVDGMDNASIAGIRASGSATASSATWIKFYDVVVRAALKNADGSDITSAYAANTVKPAEVIADLLGRYLTQFDGANAIITDSGLGISQMAYPDGITARGILDDIGLLESAFYWAVWESNNNNKYRFEYIPWPTTVRYDASIQDGFDSPGSAAELYNAVTVRYLDPFNRVKTVRRTQVVQELVDAGNLTREAFIDLGDDLAFPTQAENVGDSFLLEHKYPPNAGTLKVARPILDNLTGRMVMPWEILPGHLIRVQGVQPRVDALNPDGRDGVTIFKIVAVDFDTTGAAATLELDAQPRSVAAALARLHGKRLRKR